MKPKKVNGFPVNESEGCFNFSKSNGYGKGGKKNSRKGERNGNGGGKSSDKDNMEKEKKMESSRRVSSGGSKMFLKGRGGGKGGCLDARFLINEERVSSEMDGRDSRTTVMIKNIPNKYRFWFSPNLILSLLAFLAKVSSTSNFVLSLSYTHPLSLSLFLSCLSVEI